MSRTIVFAMVVAVATFMPAAGAEGLVAANPLINGDFDAGFVIGGLTPARPALDRCIGVGHQVIHVVESSWADWGIMTVNGAFANPSGVVNATNDDLAGQATGFPIEHVGSTAGDPDSVHECDPQFREFALVNPWNMAHDRAVGWSNDAGTDFYDFSDDGDIEAIIPSRPAEHSHNMWQSAATTTQAFSADFDAFEFRLESGQIPARANIQLGLSLSPSWMQHPFVGTFWEGAVYFTASDMVPDEDGLVSLHPIAAGEIICPDYTPCREFKAAYVAADDAGKATLLGQTRLIQTSFWQFNNAAGPVVIDDIAYVGAKTAAETMPNAGNV